MEYGFPLKEKPCCLEFFITKFANLFIKMAILVLRASWTLKRVCIAPGMSTKASKVCAVCCTWLAFNKHAF